MNDLINPLVDLSAAESYISSKITKMRLSEIRSSQHLSKKALSKLCGLSEKSIASIENENGNPTFNSIEKYLNALGYEIIFKEKNS